MTPSPLIFETLSGAALTARLDALAGLRIRVFREWPYLYDGDPAHEARYLAAYAQSPGALVVAASTPRGEAVGMATCHPGHEASEKLRASWAAAGLDAATLCYFGESVLLPEYRGQGAGVHFFQEREAHARRLGLSIAAFFQPAIKPGGEIRNGGRAPYRILQQSKPDGLCFHHENRLIQKESTCGVSRVSSTSRQCMTVEISGRGA